ncbi:MAG: hypothetical protein B6241_10670 [Spirochaetaceae bacterium 4572_59]|nr:MAG: hypothetical protein B6241_10670 [Spirochaetaceae bacterium 4572_59]
MTYSAGEPFLFKELEGTSWHRRFVAEEFQILLDHYPERIIVIDAVLSDRELRDKERLHKYQNLLINYILNNREIDDKMPIEILKNLRRFRLDIFGIGSSSVGDFQYSDRRGPLFYDRADRDLRKRLESELSKAEKVIFFPGKPGAFREELSKLIELTDAEICVVCSDDPLIFGVKEGMFDDLQRHEPFSLVKKDLSYNFPLKSEGIEKLRKRQANGVFIFTTNLWLYLEIFRKMENFGFILDNSEWFSRGLLQYSFERPGDNLKGFSSSAYTDILSRCEVVTTMTLAGLQTSPFPPDIDVSGVQYNTLSLPDFLRGQSPMSLSLSTEVKLKKFNHKSDRMQVSTGLYHIDGNGIYKTDSHDKAAVLVTLVDTYEQNVDAAPVFLNASSPPEAVIMTNSGVLASFNYYYTGNLVKYYNYQVSEREQLQIKNFSIDYLFVRSNGRVLETFPLYNKAFLGCTDKGKIFAGHFLPEKVELFLGGAKYSFLENQINPDGDGSLEGLYLPSSERKFVGTGQFCVVIIQDQIVFSGKGPCRIPPVGVVAVLREEIAENIRTVSFHISWKDMPYSRDSLNWMVGGFNLLVDNGRNLYSNTYEAERSLQNEGWYKQASRETQETQLIPGVRQPRAVFGRTKGGRLLLAQFSGRTDISCGASFCETVSFVQNKAGETDELDFLINFDGGASASIIGYRDGNYTNFCLTAASETNPVGIARCLPSYFSLTLK